MYCQVPAMQMMLTQYDEQAVDPAKKTVIVDEEAAVEAIFFLK